MGERVLAHRRPDAGAMSGPRGGRNRSRWLSRSSPGRINDGANVGVETGRPETFRQVERCEELRFQKPGDFFDTRAGKSEQVQRQISHQFFVKVPMPGAPATLKILGVDLGCDAGGMREHYADISGYEKAFTGPRDALVWQPAPGGVWSEWESARATPAPLPTGRPRRLRKKRHSRRDPRDGRTSASQSS